MEHHNFFIIRVSYLTAIQNTASLLNFDPHVTNRLNNETVILSSEILLVTTYVWKIHQNSPKTIDDVEFLCWTTKHIFFYSRVCAQLYTGLRDIFFHREGWDSISCEYKIRELSAILNESWHSICSIHKKVKIFFFATIFFNEHK